MLNKNFLHPSHRDNVGDNRNDIHTCSVLHVSCSAVNSNVTRNEEDFSTVEMLSALYADLQEWICSQHEFHDYDLLPDI
jgi:hypothetical protein